MNDYRKERERKEGRRCNIVRAICVLAAAAMLLAMVIPAIYAGL
ncbi:hypothetical protein FHX77_000425 [Bifidobacterium commune]|nr:hypothetical protein [Bifidobacterium commune]MBB2955045.1 hypothetical protein [Bifidobacterium commune]